MRACPSLGKAPIELLSESEGELEFHRKLEIAAARLYFWDSFVSGALWPWISFVEVIVRNSINDHLCAYFDVSPVDGWHTLVRDGENFVKDSKEGDFLKTRYLLLTSRDYEAFKTKLNEVKRPKRTDSITGDIFVGKGRDQAVDAPRLNSSLSISRGVAPPRICRGVSLSSSWTQATCSGVIVAKSVPFL